MAAQLEVVPAPAGKRLGAAVLDWLPPFFDIKAGRNPITTGVIQGPYSFAPLDLPPVQQVPSPVAGAAPAIVPQAATLELNQWRPSGPPAGHPDDDHDRTPLQAAQPAYVAPGSTVSFGDRTFHLGQA